MDDDETKPLEDFFFVVGLETCGMVWEDAIDECLSARRTEFKEKGARKTIGKVKHGNS